MSKANEVKLSLVNPIFPPAQSSPNVKLAGATTQPLVKVQAEPTPRKAS